MNGFLDAFFEGVAAEFEELADFCGVGGFDESAADGEVTVVCSLFWFVEVSEMEDATFVGVCEFDLLFFFFMIVITINVGVSKL